MKGKVFLVPVTLGGDDYRQVLPDKVLQKIATLRFFIVEDLRSARRFLRLIDPKFPIDESRFYILNEHTTEAETTDYLEPVEKGYDIGVMSEAGLPCIADPGSRIVQLAHLNNIVVVPLSGPSSIILALISSGLNGQKFTFHGYLPAKVPELKVALKEIEKRSLTGYTQIFMETPYRAQKLFDIITGSVDKTRMLSIATNITLPDEWIKAKKISEWIKNKPDLKDRLVIFSLL